jgi:hypothetical protein
MNRRGFWRLRRGAAFAQGRGSPNICSVIFPKGRRSRCFRRAKSAGVDADRSDGG